MGNKQKEAQAPKENPVRRCIQSGKCKSPKKCMDDKKCAFEGKPGKLGIYNR